MFKSLIGSKGTKFIYNAIASIAGLAVTLFLAFVLIPRYGLAGAGITASVSYLVSVVVKLYFLFSKYGVKGVDLILRKGEIIEFIAMLKKGGVSNG